MNNSEWEAAIRELLEEGLVKQTADPPNETYSAVEEDQND